MDGPSHLYSANILDQLWFHTSVMSKYFTTNPIPVPNWLGHFFLTLLHLVLPAFLAEKVLIVAYFFGIAYSFRWLILTLEPASRWSTFLIFPFTYGYLLILGFYNYYISFIILFIALGYWHKHKNTLHRKDGLVLFILVTLIYFTHLFTFIFSGVALVASIIWDFILSKISRSGTSSFWRQSLFLMCGFSLSLILTVNYFLKVSADGMQNSQEYSASQLEQRLLAARAIICYSYPHEKPFTSWIAVCIGMIIVIILIFHSNTFAFTKHYSMKNKSLSKAAWLIIALIILLLLFIIPNGTNAGMVSDRLEIIFFLFLLIWIGVQNIPPVVTALPVTAMLILHFILVAFYQHSIKFQNLEVKEYEQIGKDIPAYKTVLPISFSKNWIDGHYPFYMGVDKPLIILGDYEAGLKWFPVIWSESEFPDFYPGNHPQNGLPFGWYHDNNDPMKKIDYVVIWQKQNNDAYLSQIEPVLRKDYSLEKIYTDAELYRLK